MSEFALKWVIRAEQTGDCVSKALLIYLALCAQPGDVQERDDCGGLWLVVPKARVQKSGEYLAAKLDCEVKQIEAAVKHLQEWKFISLEDMSCRRGHPWPENLYVSPNGVKMCRACNRMSQRKKTSALDF